jgi:hypothetical protein
MDKYLLGLNGDISVTPVKGADEVFDFNRDYGIQRISDGKQFWIPAGFRCDGGSVPAILWPWLSPWEDGCAPSWAGHDRDYEIGDMTREEADLKMRDIQEQEGVPMWKRNLVYLGVRLGGGAAYEKCRANARAAGFPNGIRPAYDPPAPPLN